jgi:hypothetical protein
MRTITRPFRAPLVFYQHRTPGGARGYHMSPLRGSPHPLLNAKALHFRPFSRSAGTSVFSRCVGAVIQSVRGEMGTVERAVAGGLRGWALRSRRCGRHAVASRFGRSLHPSPEGAK